MRILIIHTYYASRGGEDLVFETESELLKKNGVQVFKVTFSNAKYTVLNFLFYPFNVFSFFRVAVAVLKYKPNVVHVHNWHFAGSCSIFFACKMLRVPIVQTLHNHRLISSFKTLYNGNGIKKSTKYFTEVNLKKVFGKKLLHAIWVKSSNVLYKALGICWLVDRYIVLTKNSRNLYVKNYFKSVESKFCVKSNFIDANGIMLKEKQDYLVFVGRLTVEKGIHVLLSAINNTNYRLKIIGDGPLRDVVEQAMSKNPNIEYLGFQNFDFIKEVVASGKALIFPSVTLEGMPMTIIEAFACSTPVVAPKYSAMETMITDGYNGFHFEKANADSLKDALDRLYYLNKLELNSMIDNARSTYEENYSPEKNLAKLISIYEGVARNKRKAAKAQLSSNQN